MQQTAVGPQWDLAETRHSAFTEVRFTLAGTPEVEHRLGRGRLFVPTSGLCVRRTENGKPLPDRIWLWGEAGHDFAHFDKRPELEARPGWVRALTDTVIAGVPLQPGSAPDGMAFTETDRHTGEDMYWKHRVSGAPMFDGGRQGQFSPDVVVLTAARSTRDAPGPGWARFGVHALAIDRATKRSYSSIIDGPMEDAARLLPGWIADRLALFTA